MTVIFFLLFILEFVQFFSQALKVDIEVLEPRGVIISTPDDNGIEGFFFWGNINEEFISTNKSKIRLGTVFPVNGKWVIHDENLALQNGDVVNYVLFIKRHSVIERYEHRKFIVSGLKQSVYQSNKILPDQIVFEIPVFNVSTSTPISTSSAVLPTVPSDGLRNSTIRSDIALQSSTTQIPSNSTSIIKPSLYINATAPYSNAANRTIIISKELNITQTNATTTEEQIPKPLQSNYNDTIFPTVQENTTLSIAGIDIFRNTSKKTNVEFLNTTHDDSKSTNAGQISTYNANASSINFITNTTTTMSIQSIINTQTPQASTMSSKTSVEASSEVASATSSADSANITPASVLPPKIISTTPESSVIVNTSFSNEISTHPNSAGSNLISIPTTLATPIPSTNQLPMSKEGKPPQYSDDCSHRIHLETDDFTLDMYGNKDMSNINPKMLASLIVNDCAVEYKITEEEPNTVEFYIS